MLRFLHRGNLDVVAIVTCGGGVGARNINTIKEREKCISSILEVLVLSEMCIVVILSDHGIQN